MIATKHRATPLTALVGLIASALSAGCAPEAPALPERQLSAIDLDAPSVAVRPDSFLIIHEPKLGAVIAMSPDQEIAWRFDLDQKEELIVPPVVASDSVTYVRSTKRLVALDVDGTVRWSRPLPPDGAVGRLATLEVLPSSAVVFVESPRKLIAIAPEGEQMWAQEFPVGERLTAPPRAGPSNEVTALTNAAVITIDPKGGTAWYRLRPAVVEP